MGNCPNINQRYTKVGPEIKTQVNKILHPEIDRLVEEEIKVVTEEITTIGTIVDQVIEID